MIVNLCSIELGHNDCTQGINNEENHLRIARSSHQLFTIIIFTRTNLAAGLTMEIPKLGKHSERLGSPEGSVRVCVACLWTVWTGD